MMLFLGALREAEMLEIKHLRPWIAEIGEPRQTGCPTELQAYQMHRLGRPRGHYGIHRMGFQVFFKETDRRVNPEDPRVRDEEVPPDEKGQPLLPGFLPPVDRIDFILVGRGSSQGLQVGGTALSHYLAVYSVRFGDMPLYYLSLGRYLVRKSLVNCGKLRVLRSIYHRLPSSSGKVLCELDPALDAGTAGRRPIIGYDQNSLHRGLNASNSQFFLHRA